MSPKNSSSKITGRLEGFLGRILEPLLKTGLLLIKSVLKPLDKSVLTPLGLTTSSSATDAAIQKKIFESCMALSISNEGMNEIMKIIKSLVY